MLIRTKKGDLKEIIYNEKQLYNYGLNRLASREYGRKELQLKMVRLQPDLDMVNAVLDKLEKLGYLSEERRIKSILSSYSSSESISKTKQRILQKGMDKELLEQIIADKAEELIGEQTPIGLEIETAVNLLERKFRSFNSEDWNKMVSFLARKGYSYDKIKAAVEVFKAG